MVKTMLKPKNNKDIISYNDKFTYQYGEFDKLESEIVMTKWFRNMPYIELIPETSNNILMDSHAYCPHCHNHLGTFEEEYKSKIIFSIISEPYTGKTAKTCKICLKYFILFTEPNN